MSSQGRGGALAAVVVALICLSLVLEVAQAKTYSVGANGWKPGCITWPRKMHFKAGDYLVFNFPPEVHNVVVVNKAQYRSCTAPPENVRRYFTGNDRIKLVKGMNYFLCTYPGHCQAGMRMAIKAR